MKRTIFVSALVLALMVTLCGEAFSLSAPWGYVDPGTTSDDHTWGGDFQAGPNDPGYHFEGISSGWIPINMIITTVLFEWLNFYSLADKSCTEADLFIQNQTLETEPIEPVIPTNTGGLQ